MTRPSDKTKQPKLKTPDPKRVNIIKNNEVVASGHNLEVITRYNREKSSIEKMKLGKADKGEGKLTVIFGNGARVDTGFASHSVMVDWAEKKQRRFGFDLKKD